MGDMDVYIDGTTNGGNSTAASGTNVGADADATADVARTTTTDGGGTEAGAEDKEEEKEVEEEAEDHTAAANVVRTESDADTGIISPLYLQTRKQNSGITKLSFALFISTTT